MNGCQVQLLIDGDRQSFAPGETLAGECRLDAPRRDDIEAIELSIMWYTEGTGDEDLAVHYFERRGPENGRTDLREPRRFSTELPNSPLSYDGVIVKLHWCVRVRVFLPRGKDMLVEAPFQLGNVPPAKLPEEPSA
ncbi:MAG: hypothetical protein AB7O62_05685 [Pirellulales bacterium]